MSKDIGLRDKNRAHIKLNVLECTLQLIGNCSFEDIQVHDICEKAEISRVTYFKYFPRKEDILVYFFRIWSFHRTVEQLRDPKRGIQGIEHLFKKVADFPNAHGIMRNLISFITHLKEPLRSVKVEKAEKLFLYPGDKDVLDLPVLSQSEMFYQFIIEAIEDGKIRKDVNPGDIVKALTTVFYGVPIGSHIRQEQDLWPIYKINLDLIFKALRNED